MSDLIHEERCACGATFEASIEGIAIAAQHFRDYPEIAAGYSRELGAQAHVWREEHKHEGPEGRDRDRLDPRLDVDAGEPGLSDAEGRRPLGAERVEFEVERQRVTAFAIERRLDERGGTWIALLEAHHAADGITRFVACDVCNAWYTAVPQP